MSFNFKGEIVDAQRFGNHLASFSAPPFEDKGDTLYPHIYPIVTGTTLDSPCPALDGDGTTCTLHADKPAMCPTTFLLNPTGVPNTLANTLTHLGGTHGIPLAQQFRGNYTTRNQQVASTNGHVFLNGIEKYWVQQKVPNDCWAATLVAARGFLHLPYVSQEDILATAERSCQRLTHQKIGASAYQIIYAISRLHSSDGKASSVHPHFCNSFTCIVASLTRKQPVIMLNSEHAVLIVGADYHSVSINGNSTIRYGTFSILDPWSNGEVETKSLFSMCRADAFISY